jgi:catalase
MSPQQKQVLYENTMRNMGDAPREIKIRHIANCWKVDPAYGEGMAKACGMPIEDIPKN